MAVYSFTIRVTDRNNGCTAHWALNLLYGIECMSADAVLVSVSGGDNVKTDTWDISQYRADSDAKHLPIIQSFSMGKFSCLRSLLVTFLCVR